MKNKTKEQLLNERKQLVSMLELSNIDLQRRAELLIAIDELTKEIKRRENNENKKSISTPK